MFHAFTWSRQRRIRGIGHGSDGAPEVACRRSFRENEERRVIALFLPAGTRKIGALQTANKHEEAPADKLSRTEVL